MRTAETQCLRQLVRDLQLQTRNSQVRLVGTEPTHHFRKLKRGNGIGRSTLMSLKTEANRPSINRVDLLERGETHLDVELRELRLAIGAQVFITETVCDLEVLIETANHAQLFEELW